MFKFFAKEAPVAKPEAVRTVTSAEAYTLQSVWGSQKLKDEISTYEALMAYMAADRAAADPLMRTGILENIQRILAHDCGIQFASDSELEHFIGDYLLLTQS